MTVVRILLVLLAAYSIFCIGPAIVMFRTIFFHRTEIDRKKDYLRPYEPLLADARQKLDAHPMTEVAVTAHDGTTLRADYYHGGYARTAILLHGYRATPRSNCTYQASLLLNAGYNVLLVYQRAHGKSDGRFCTLGYREHMDLLDWIRFASRDQTVHHLVLYGVSMGAATIALASDKLAGTRVRAMVLDCGFDGIHEQLREDSRKLHVPTWTALPVLRLFYRIRFGYDIKTPMAATLQNTAIPAFFLHGMADESVPVSHSKTNYAACASQKQIRLVPDANHTCAMLQGGTEIAADVLNFLDEQTHIST